MPLRQQALPGHPVDAQTVKAQGPVSLETLWQVSRLQQQLSTLLADVQVQVRPELSSTNDALLALARATPPGSSPAPTVLVAERQTHGRGRMGRQWLSEAGTALTFSLGLMLKPADWNGLSLAVGLALAEALDPTGPAPCIGLKWPNDLMSLNPTAPGKLGGVLVETATVGARRWCVVGVGVNVRLPNASSFAPGSFSQGVAALSQLDSTATPVHTLHTLLQPLLDAVLRFEREGFGPLQAAYYRRDTLRGHSVQAGDLHGMALGVDAGGALLLQGHQDDQPRRVISGEVSVRKLNVLAAEAV